MLAFHCGQRKQRREKRVLRFGKYSVPIWTESSNRTRKITLTVSASPTYSAPVNSTINHYEYHCPSD